MTCGCEVMGSPVPGVLWAPETFPNGVLFGEIQRCDTHRPGPLFAHDGDAANSMAMCGFVVSEDWSEGIPAFFAEIPPEPERRAA